MEEGNSRETPYRETSRQLTEDRARWLEGSLRHFARHLTWTNGEEDGPTQGALAEDGCIICPTCLALYEGEEMRQLRARSHIVPTHSVGTSGSSLQRESQIHSTCPQCLSAIPHHHNEQLRQQWVGTWIRDTHRGLCIQHGNPATALTRAATVHVCERRNLNAHFPSHASHNLVHDGILGTCDALCPTRFRHPFSAPLEDKRSADLFGGFAADKVRGLPHLDNWRSQTSSSGAESSTLDTVRASLTHAIYNAIACNAGAQAYGGTHTPQLEHVHAEGGTTTAQRSRATPQEWGSHGHQRGTEEGGQSQSSYLAATGQSDTARAPTHTDALDASLASADLNQASSPTTAHALAQHVPLAPPPIPKAPPPQLRLADLPSNWRGPSWGRHNGSGEEAPSAGAGTRHNPHALQQPEHHDSGRHTDFDDDGEFVMTLRLRARPSLSWSEIFQLNGLMPTTVPPAQGGQGRGQIHRNQELNNQEGRSQEQGHGFSGSSTQRWIRTNQQTNARRAELVNMFLHLVDTMELLRVHDARGGENTPDRPSSDWAHDGTNSDSEDDLLGSRSSDSSASTRATHGSSAA